MVNKGQIVGIDWNRIALLHSQALAHMNTLTASCCHIKASRMNSLTASHHHINACRDASNQPPTVSEYTNREITTTPFV